MYNTIFVNILNIQYIIFRNNGEIRKIETDRVAIGTFSAKRLIPVFKEYFPCSIIDTYNQSNLSVQKDSRKTLLQSNCATRFYKKIILRRHSFI